MTDKLRKIFDMQADFNNLVFRENGIPIVTGSIYVDARLDEGFLGVNDLPNEWLTKFSKAMRSELDELDDELLWKWWSKDKIDIQNIRVELVDILHFLVSACMAAGMSDEELFDLYCKKMEVNYNRQKEGYCKETKDETDNRDLK